MQAYDDDWRRIHLATIGGSSAAAALGKARFRTRQQLWDTMHRVIVEGILPPPIRENDDMRRGNVFERAARDLMADTLGVSIESHDQCRFMFNTDLYPWAHALPDGWIGDHPVELKVPRPQTIAKCNGEGLIEEWWIQAQHTLAVVGAKIMFIGLLDPMSGLIHRFDVRAEPPFIERIMVAERAFYASIIANQRPDAVDEGPPPDPSADIPILQGEEIESLCRAYIRLRGIESAAKKAKERARDDMLEIAGRAEEFFVSGVARCTYKLSEPRPRLDDRAIEEYHPDVYADDRCWTTPPGSRSFGVYPDRA